MGLVQYAVNWAENHYLRWRDGKDQGKKREKWNEEAHWTYRLSVREDQGKCNAVFVPQHPEFVVYGLGGPGGIRGPPQGHHRRLMDV